MIIDLHVHSKTCSDGNLSVNEIIREAKNRNIKLISITDHDSIRCQRQAISLARKNQIKYLIGVELNVTISDSKFYRGRPISLDLLGYNFDVNNKTLNKELTKIAEYRKERIKKIFEKLNIVLKKEKNIILNENDLIQIQNLANGVLGRPHIADYLVKKRIVRDRVEAFTKYLVKCNVPKYPLCLKDGADLIRNAGGISVLAHPNDNYGTSLIKITKSLQDQTSIIEDLFLDDIDGIECWHSRSDAKTTDHYVKFSRKYDLIMTGGSDCHQKPIIMGSVKVPSFVADQFKNYFS